MLRTYSGALSMILVAIVCFVFGCSESGDSKTDSKPGRPDTLSNNQPFDSLVIEIIGADSLTVFDALLQSHEVERFSTAAGVFVWGIDSVFNSRDYFWLYSVNYSMPQAAADRYMTRDGDTVRWHYRRINK